MTVGLRLPANTVTHLSFRRRNAKLCRDASLFGGLNSHVARVGPPLPQPIASSASLILDSPRNVEQMGLVASLAGGLIRSNDADVNLVVGLIPNL
jgi:hypothetical protein